MYAIEFNYLLSAVVLIQLVRVSPFIFFIFTWIDLWKPVRSSYVQVQGPLNVMWFWTSWKSIFLALIMVCNGLKMKIKLRLLLPGPFFQKWTWYMTWKLSLKMGKISNGTAKCQVNSWKIVLLCEMLNG